MSSNREVRLSCCTPTSTFRVATKMAELGMLTIRVDISDEVDDILRRVTPKGASHQLSS